MHLQTVNEDRKFKGKIRVWLENRGKRTFDVDICPDDPTSRKAVEALRKKLGSDRDEVESAWTKLMVDKGWVQAQLQGDTVLVIAYPEFPSSKFTRSISLKSEAPGFYPTLNPSDDIIIRIKSDTTSLSVSAKGHEFVDIPLESILWE
jgi:hypothetical protein